MSYGIKMNLLSFREKSTLKQLQVELLPTGIEFKKQLTLPNMVKIGQILIDLHWRTNDEDNLINLAIGDWVNQIDDWYGKDVGINIATKIRPTLMASCFISYSHNDENFATKLYKTLLSANLSAWYAPQNIQGGKKIYEQVNKALSQADKLLTILSESSLDSQWVITEIRNAHKIETDRKISKLFPIRIIDYDILSNWECFDPDTGKDLAIEIRRYFIPDFSEWKNDEAFNESFSKLLDDLKKK